MRKTTWMLAGALALLSVPAFAADGDAPLGKDPVWARWQGRLSLGNTAPTWHLGVEAPAYKLGSASLMGDYYFGPSLLGGSAADLGGFRATSGLIVGPRGVRSIGQPGLSAGSAFSLGSRLFGQPAISSPSDPAVDNTALSYVGVGYTGLSVRSGWSFSADLGMVAQSSVNARLGRVFGYGQSLDDGRDMRISPLLQLGVSYSF